MKTLIAISLFLAMSVVFSIMSQMFKAMPEKKQEKFFYVFLILIIDWVYCMLVASFNYGKARTIAISLLYVGYWSGTVIYLGWPMYLFPLITVVWFAAVEIFFFIVTRKCYNY